MEMPIGVGARSTLGGQTFLPEKYVCKNNIMSEFYIIFARKMPELYIIIARKKYFSRILGREARGGARAPLTPVSDAYGNTGFRTPDLSHAK